MLCCHAPEGQTNSDSQISAHSETYAEEQDRPGNELKCPWATNQMLMADLLGLFGPILSQ